MEKRVAEGVWLGALACQAGIGRQTERRRTRETSAKWGVGEGAMPSTNCGEDAAGRRIGSPSATLQEIESRPPARDAAKSLIMDIVRQSSRPFSLLRGRLRVLCFEFTLGSPSETKGVSRWRDSGKVIDSRWLAQISGVRDGQWSRSEQALLSITSSRLPEGRELPWPVFVNFSRRRDTSIWTTFTFDCGTGHFPDDHPGVGGAGLRCGVGEDLSAVPGKYRQRALPVSDRAAPSRLTLRDRCQSRHVLVLGKFPASVRGCPTPPPNRSVQTHGEGFVVAQVDRRHVG